MQGRNILIDVADAGELRTVIAYVGRLQSNLGIERMLHVQVPRIDVRRFEILCDSHDGAWAASRHAAVNGASREDCAAANIVPIQRRSWEGDEPGGNVPRPGRDSNAAGWNC